MKKILVTEAVTGAAMDQLRASSDLEVALEPDLWRDPDALARAIQTADALIVRNQTQVTADLIQTAPRLQIIARAGAGLDNVDTDAASAAGIVVSSAPSENSLSVAELAIGLFLALARHIPSANQDVQEGNWNRTRFTGSELSGKTLGIVGAGRIGTLVAQRAKAFGMTLIVHDTFVDPHAPQYAGLDLSFVEMDELLSRSDFVTVHLPLLPETRGLFTSALFEQMKPTAYFVNTSRGKVVDEAALAHALDQGCLAGAALDVREVEPPSPGNPLAGSDRVIFTPHIAAFTREAQERVVAAVCRDASAVLRGDEALGYFNFARPKRAFT